MSAEPPALPKQSSGLFSFLESLFSLTLLLLMAIGLVAITASWRSSSIELLPGDRVRVIQSSWWGLSKDLSIYRADPGTGWRLIRENEDEVPMSSQPIRLPN